METKETDQEKKENKIDFEVLGEMFDDFLFFGLIVLLGFMAFFG